MEDLNYTPKSSFLKEFIARGYFYQCTDIEGLDKKFASETIIAYSGTDCTGKSLHVGHLIQVMVLRLLQKHGHKPLPLVGGATSKIGDPSFKDKARSLLSEEEIQENLEGIVHCMKKFIKFGNEKTDAELVNNSDWLMKIGYIEFLRDYGKHFSVNRMLGMDSVKTRLEREQSLSFLEFSYMLLQATDFAYLNKHKNCILQIGGSDQWSNIINGVDLARKLGLKDSFGLTTPLLTTASGAKMGKTEAGAVWIKEDMLSPYDYWQFWRNTDDRDVIRFMKMFTDLSLEEIASLENTEKNINNLKVILANEATKLCHGEEEAKKSEAIAASTFGGNRSGEGLPEFEILQSDLENGKALYEIMRESGVVETGAEAKRMIKSNAVKLDDNIINEEMKKVFTNDFVNNKLKLSVGKKKHIMLVLK
ncbi:MAG: tyrosine--tRNA ligase [Sphingobacteriia bacterium]|nr:tyrosine--tRNA ligase [Sphingobacteriia bacterium]